KSGSVTSLNDGSLSAGKSSGAESTSYAYPNPGWVSGVVGFGPAGPPNWDPARRVLTFTSGLLEKDLEIAGPIKLVLYASSAQREISVRADPAGYAVTSSRRPLTRYITPSVITVQRVHWRNEASLMRSSTCLESEVPTKASSTIVPASHGVTCVPWMAITPPK